LTKQMGVSGDLTVDSIAELKLKDLQNKFD